jgi:predicted alpha/beta-hydrolase family hydrolase
MRLEIADGWVDFDRPRNATSLLVLTHGAGAAVTSRDLTAVRDAATTNRVAVALVTQPYRVAGRRTPPKTARQDEAWLAVLAGLLARRGVGSLPLVVGGRSNGARVACRTAAALGAVGVVAMAFPLHPPGKPENSRLAELELPTVPVLVVQGSRDPFGMPPPGRGRTIRVVEGADHSLRKHFGGVPEAIVQFVTSTSAHASV